MRTTSWNSTIPAKSAKKEEPRLSNEELSYRKAEEDKRKKDVFVTRKVQFNRGPDLCMERRFSVAEARKREGLAPQTKAPSGEQTNSLMWYNWRTSRSNKRTPIAERKRNTLLVDWLKLDRSTVHSLSELIQSELYCIVVMLMVHAGYVRVPPFMGRSYLNAAHTVNGALERLRWLIPGVVKDFGSDPEETIKQRFHRRGLPPHLEPYTLNTPRTESRPKGERMIDRRIHVTSSTASTQLEVTSTSTGSKPDLRTKLSVKTQDLSPAKQVEESVIIQVTSKETSPVATEMDIDTPEPVAEAATEKKDEAKVDASGAVFAFRDVRQKTWNAQRESIKSSLLLFQQDRAVEAGTRELSRYLREKLVSKMAQQELMPDKLIRINDDEMALIIARCAGLSIKALAPADPLTRISVDSDSGKPDSEPYYEVTDTQDEDLKDDDIFADSPAEQESATSPRKDNTPPRKQRKSNSRTSSSRESVKKIVMRKPSFQSQHFRYTIPKHSKSKSERTERSRRRSRSRSCSRDSTPCSSTQRGSSSCKRKEYKRRDKGQ